ncbi:hypothetical protein PENTCL1PPCAC_27170 [Pristionchus entomophagus]|uniref:C2H2-type domain-containing protein n=1 Tax=Pristionchus entomophagus TaxID=358040 RepID=A0AAV5UDF1_9BILA|nr:hypothetical protein PENTCL1PPCAC_27170 [Pristionchus entomophagus]
MQHDSSLKENGIYLTCECGLEVSSRHVNKAHNIIKVCIYIYICALTFNVHNIDDKPKAMHTIDDKPKIVRKRNRTKPIKWKTPKCITCEIYPRAANVYAKHLFNAHGTTLKSNGIYLMCSCGSEIRCSKRDATHGKKCKSRTFTLHRSSENVHHNPQCVLCEATPSTVFAYTMHLHTRHRSSIEQNGIYLTCSCGQNIRSGSFHFDCEGKQFTLHR